MSKISPTAPLLAVIEAGGTKFNCELVTGAGAVLEQAVIPTQAPCITLAQVSDFFNAASARHGAFAAMGIGSFGPVELNPAAANYGCITHTPKAGWRDTPIVDFFTREFGVPIGFETDVNAALLGELAEGAAQGCQHAIYITFGTGIGAGICVDGKLLQGRAHPEVGHLLIPSLAQDSFAGCCPFHGNCAEGLASGTALTQRWQQAPTKLPADHRAWPMQAYYAAALCVNLTQCFAPEKIVLGGGVMQQPRLLGMIQQQFLELLQGYGPVAVLDNVQDFIVATSLHGRAGVLGARLLAASALNTVTPAVNV